MVAGGRGVVATVVWMGLVVEVHGGGTVTVSRSVAAGVIADGAVDGNDLAFFAGGGLYRGSLFAGFRVDGRILLVFAAVVGIGHGVARETRLYSTAV